MNVLIDALLKNPVAFHEQGRAIELLDCYVDGLPIDTLRPLLSHHNDHVRRAAVLIANKLGTKAGELLDEVVPLVSHPIPLVAADAMEVVLQCAMSDTADRFAAVVVQLERSDGALRRLAMRMVAIAQANQLEAARQSCRLGQRASLHAEGLREVLDAQNATPKRVRAMLDSRSLLTRYYGAILVDRLAVKHPDLLWCAVMNSNEDVGKFALRSLEKPLNPLYAPAIPCVLPRRGAGRKEKRRDES